MNSERPYIFFDLFSKASCELVDQRLRIRLKGLKANFYEKALFVKPTWRLYVVAECNSFECPSRYASIRTLRELTLSLWWLGT
jgi:hypothetical protein